MSSSKSKVIDLGAIPAQGLTVIYEDDTADIDICFVHGFTGHPYRTWLEQHGDESQRSDEESQHNDDSKDGTERETKARRLQFPKPSRSRARLNRQVYWPSMLLPSTVPTSRIMVYGYDTHIRHKWAHAPSHAGVYEFGWDLLNCLEERRREAPLRPILFIVHSLGGIVVKEMLRRSKGCETHQTHLRQTYDSTTGIIFFGTPHGGADPRGAGHRIMQSIAEVVGFGANNQVIDTLFPSSERLRELRDEFSPMVKEKDWIIYCFQEQYGIVEDPSSCLNDVTIEVTQYVAANHMDICRFRGIDDAEYKKVAAAVHRIVERVVMPTQRCTQLKTRALGPAPITQERLIDLEDSLKFAQFNERKRAIKPAHDDTCWWILEDVQYISWLHPKGKDRDNYFMWIKGKPGTGKSTLMKLICNHADETMPDSAVISFFFHARGGDLEKTTTGLYRSLLLQIISTQPSLQSVLYYVPLLAPSQTGLVEWTNEILKELISHAIRESKRRIICFIDALDECSEEQIRDMISFLYGIIKTDSSQNFSVCFSSRHYPHISIPAGQQLVLESREDHRHDIATYLGGELRIGSSYRSERIKAEILRRSSGIFVWVVLVISILNREYGKGRVHLLQKRLREIPGSLYELFSDLVTRDTEDMDDMILCLQWTLFSARSLTLEELYFGMMSKLSRKDWDLLDIDDISSQDMERFIVNASKGLVEATGTAHLPIQFIHETVRDFLLDERATSRLLPQLDGRFLGKSHEVLRDLCLATLNFAFKADGITLRPSSIFEARISHPFLDYATEHILHHSNAAQIAGIPQHGFLQSFPLQKWLACERLLRARYTPKARLLYILADNNYAALVAVDPQRAEHMETRGEEFGLPILAAICQGHSGLANTLLHVCEETTGFDPSVLADEDVPRFLTIAAKYGTTASLEAISSLWPQGVFNLDYADDSNRTLLMHAVCQENMEVVEYLLDRGADSNVQDDEGQTAFHLAIKALNLTMVQCLADHGAKLMSTNADMTELLDMAFNTGTGHRKKQIEIFFFLLSTGMIKGLDISKKQANLWLGMDLARLQSKIVQELTVRSTIKTTVEYVARIEQKVLKIISI